MDVHIPYSIASQLRLRGVDVLTSQEDGTQAVLYGFSVLAGC